MHPSTIASAWLVVALTFGTHKIHGATLSGAVVFSAGTDGEAANGQIWDTGSDVTLSRLFISVLTPTGYVALNGPDASHGAVNYLLHPGTNSFRLTGQSGQSQPFAVFGLNLFLDGKPLPVISIKAPLGGGALSTNSSTNTLAPNKIPVPAAGTLEYSNVLEKVALIATIWNSSSDGAGGVLDLIVQPQNAPMDIRFSEVEVCWWSLPNVPYQVVYRSVLTTNIWTTLGTPVLGDGLRDCIRDQVGPGQPQRFYSVVRVQ